MSIILSYINKLIIKLYSKIIDRYAYTKQTNVLVRILYTTRYKLAASGFVFADNERKILSYKNKHEGERCFILGNGPSLNKCDLSLLKEEVTFGVNAIYLNYENMGYNPTYYVVEDSHVIEDRRTEICDYEGPQQKFIGVYAKPLLSKCKKTVFLNLIRNYSDKINFPMFSEDILRKVGVGGSVSFVCLELAFYMGFKEVYLIGFDHNYVIPESAKIDNIRETGFDITSTDDDVNHFHPDYFGKGYKWHDPDTKRMEMGFRKAKEVFMANNRTIMNATIGGKLEVFKRVNYDSLF